MSELEAGRELDAEIAEKLMGWGHVLDPLGELTGKPLPQEQTVHWLSGIPNYSTDIAAAWQVVERMHELGWRYAVEDRWHLVLDGNGGVSVRNHYATFWRPVPLEVRRHIAVGGATPALAICRAALAAVAYLPEDQP